jgi:hypothetical protein
MDFISGGTNTKHFLLAQERLNKEAKPNPNIIDITIFPNLF